MAGEILAVERSQLDLPVAAKAFFKANRTSLYRQILQNPLYLEQTAIEEDDDYLQIVPWILMQRERRLWVMSRPTSTGDARLPNNAWSLGINDHIPKPIMPVGDPIAWGTRRLWTNTFWLDLNCNAHLAGFVWDRSNEVGRHHLGVLFYIGLSAGIPELQSGVGAVGSFQRLTSIIKHEQDLDPWSKSILPDLSSGEVTEALPMARLFLPSNYIDSSLAPLPD